MKSSVTVYDIVSWVLSGIFLCLILKLHLLTVFISGLLVFELVHFLVARLYLGRLGDNRAILIAVFIIACDYRMFESGCCRAYCFFRTEDGNIPALLNRVADIIDQSKSLMPEWVVSGLPVDVFELQRTLVELLHNHASDLQMLGKEAGRMFVQILLGMILGAMLCFNHHVVLSKTPPLTLALKQRAQKLGESFRCIVFAQLRISGINAILTAVYLMLILPLFDIHLPFVRVLVFVTFVLGLLPVIGNIISNTVIAIVALSISVQVVIASLLYLILIHKLEYFLNAHIMGARISARPWELLIAMLFFEAAFGMTGLIAAPIYYAYIKNELASRSVI